MQIICKHYSVMNTNIHYSVKHTTSIQREVYNIHYTVKHTIIQSSVMPTNIHSADTKQVTR